MILLAISTERSTTELESSIMALWRSESTAPWALAMMSAASRWALASTAERTSSASFLALATMASASWCASRILAS